MKSLTLLRFAFAFSMSKIVIIFTDMKLSTREECEPDLLGRQSSVGESRRILHSSLFILHFPTVLQKGGVPAAPSGTATLLRLSPNYQFRPRPILAVTDFRRPRLSWLDGRCVQGPGTYSPRHG